MKPLIFKTDVNFYKYIETVFSDLEINKTITSSRFAFVTKDGKFYKNQNFYKMLDKLNELIGKDHFNSKDSRAKGQRTYLVFLTEKDSAPKEVISKTVPELEKALVDWDKVSKFEDSKEGKLALDLYAEGFGVKLKASMKLSNMIKDFKDATKS